MCSQVHQGLFPSLLAQDGPLTSRHPTIGPVLLFLEPCIFFEEGSTFVGCSIWVLWVVLAWTWKFVRYGAETRIESAGSPPPLCSALLCPLRLSPSGHSRFSDPKRGARGNMVEGV